ncbi:MAG: YbjQ family protein [Chloroflexi bacterium]|nr:YbjQ family protein [Chloroflexota bacterium]
MTENPQIPMVAREMTSTTFDLPGYRAVRSLGVVRGITVRSANFAKQITGAFRTLGGGEIHEYVEVAEQSRERAFVRLLEHAALMGANAVLGIRYDATEMVTNMNEVIAYGTAVIVERYG